jgi:hypothetical protein
MSRRVACASITCTIIDDGCHSERSTRGAPEGIVIPSEARAERWRELSFRAKAQSAEVEESQSVPTEGPLYLDALRFLDSPSARSE